MEESVVFDDILFWVVVIVVFQTIQTEVFSIKLAISDQFCQFMIIEKSFTSRVDYGSF
jgi:hypothetical protein